MKFMNILMGGVEKLLFVILFAMVILVFGNVIARFVFDAAITWAEEISRFLFIWLTFLGAALGVHKAAHIGMDILVTRVPENLRVLFDLVGNVLIIIFLGIWFSSGFDLIKMNLNYLAPASGLPMYLVYIVGPIVSAIMILQHLLLIVQGIKTLKG